MNFMVMLDCWVWTVGIFAFDMLMMDLSHWCMYDCIYHMLVQRSPTVYDMYVPVHLVYRVYIQ